MDEAPSLSEILDDLTFPAEKWQITTCADLYGADIHTRRALYGLPALRYGSADDVTTTLAENVDDTALSRF